MLAVHAFPDRRVEIEDGPGYIFKLAALSEWNEVIMYGFRFGQALGLVLGSSSFRFYHSEYRVVFGLDFD